MRYLPLEIFRQGRYRIRTPDNRWLYRHLKPPGLFKPFNRGGNPAVQALRENSRQCRQQAKANQYKRFFHTLFPPFSKYFSSPPVKKIVSLFIC
jgi:hypothetical protein